jgi:hypothetical protein
LLTQIVLRIIFETMNTSLASNPFTGLKGALAGLMSGGLLGLLLGLLFRRRIAPMLTALEGLFAQWKAGTLAPLAVALPVPAAPVRPKARTPVARPRAAAPVMSRARCPVEASRRRHVHRPAAAPVRAVAWPPLVAPRLLVAPSRAPHPPPHRARCRKTPLASVASARPNCYVIKTISGPPNG